MTDRDVLVERLFDEAGVPLVETPVDPADPVEEVWRVSAGDKSCTLHPLTDAIDVALKWAAQTDGRILIRRTAGGEPTLYEPTT